MEIYLLSINILILLIVCLLAYLIYKKITGKSNIIQSEVKTINPDLVNVKENELMHLLPYPAIMIDINGNIVDYNFMSKELLPNIEIGKRSEADLILSTTEAELPFKEAFINRKTITKKFLYKQSVYSMLVIPYYENSNIVGFYELFLDISEVEQLKKDRGQKSKLETVGHLSMGMAHDFNNILQVIMGHAELCLDEDDIDDATKDNLEIILQAGDKACSLTRQLLIFSRKQEGDYKLLELNAIIKSMQKMLDRLLGENIKIELNLWKSGLELKADEIHLEQVILNLCVNARDAMPSGGTIKVSTELIDVMAGDFDSNPERLPGQYIKLSVADTGTGISQEHIDKIFEPFFTTKGKGKGTGLGLANVLGIIKQYNGFIDIESNIGFGTVFKIFIPHKTFSVDTQIIDTEVKQEAKLELNNQHVLLIEDDDLICQVVTKMLRKNKLKVSICKDITSATKLLNEDLSKFDLIISDLILPDGNGYDLYKSLQQINNKIPFIITSGYSEEREELKNLISEGVCFLKKPFSVKDLMGKVKEIYNASKNRDIDKETMSNSKN